MQLAAHPETTLPSPPDHDDFEGVLSVNEVDIRQAICSDCSFPKCSAGGPDSLQPQHRHLLDLTSPTAGPRGVSLRSLILHLQILVLSGNTPIIVRPFLFSTSLVALKKEIVWISCEQLQLDVPFIAKCAVLYCPHAVQLGYGTPLDTEAADLLPPPPPPPPLS